MLGRMGDTGDKQVGPCTESAWFPISHIQQYLWDKVEQKSHSPWSLNMTSAIGISGAIDKRALRAAIQEVLDSVEILRANFKYKNGTRVQAIRPDVRFRLREVNCRSLEREESISALKKALARRKFDIENDLLIRGYLLRRSEHSATLFFVIHHLVFDNSSRKPFNEALIATLKGEKFGVRKLREAARYRDFVLRERQLPSEMIRKNACYWERKLRGGGVPSSITPIQMRSHHNNCSIKRFVISERIRDELQKIARREGCSLFIVMCAIFAASWYKFCNEKDFFLWFPLIQRSEQGLENTIGPVYVNLPLRIVVKEGADLVAFIRSIRSDVFDAMEHQWVGAAQLQHIANERHRLSLNYLDVRPFGVSADEPVSGDFHVKEQQERDVERHPGELQASIMNCTDGIDGAFNYNITRFRDTGIRTLLEGFFETISIWSRDPSIKISHLQNR